MAKKMKLKTHKGASKRFKRTATGKIMKTRLRELYGSHVPPGN